jgi:hypothetical protein
VGSKRRVHRHLTLLKDRPTRPLHVVLGLRVVLGDGVLQPRQNFSHRLYVGFDFTVADVHINPTTKGGSFHPLNLRFQGVRGKPDSTPTTGEIRTPEQMTLDLRAVVLIVDRTIQRLSAFTASLGCPR